MAGPVVTRLSIAETIRPGPEAASHPWPFITLLFSRQFLNGAKDATQDIVFINIWPGA